MDIFSGVVRTCPVCDIGFQPTNGIQKYCTVSCRNKKDYRENRAARIAYQSEYENKNRDSVLKKKRKRWADLRLDPERYRRYLDGRRKNRDPFAQMKKLYGLTQDQYEEMYSAQLGLCGICKREQKSTRNSRLCIDHCHRTGKIRGLLCGDCNRGIGLLGDNANTIEMAAQYVRQF